MTTDTDRWHRDLGAGLVRDVLPSAVVSQDAVTDGAYELFPEEESAVEQAVESRRREFATVRHCARLALERLDVPAVAVPTGPDRAPIWPSGIVGSLTHCHGYRAAAVARVSEVWCLGIDAEPHHALPADVLRAVASFDEVERLDAMTEDDDSIHWPLILFSAKESLYKAWYPVTKEWLGFEDVHLEIDAAERTFAVTFLGSAPQIEHEFDGVTGRWAVSDGFVITSVVGLTES